MLIMGRVRNNCNEEVPARGRDGDASVEYKARKGV